MGYRTENVEALVAYFESGVKPENEPGRLGVELEHTIVSEGLMPVSYEGPHGVKWVLGQLLEDYPDATYDDEGDLLGVARPDYAITLEPAAQLELSAGPYEEIGAIRVDFDEFQRNLNKLLSAQGMHALAVGYHPTARAQELSIIPKARYRIMDEHFKRIGPYGACMMRGSAATQVSIDYYSEQDCMRKLRLASALSPIFALMCDNASVFEGTAATHHMVRTKIWQECDPLRCGIVPGVMDEDFSFEKYAHYVLRTPAVVGIDEDGAPFATEATFDDLYSDRDMAQRDVEHALSMFFNDARLKTYIEIRPADAMPIPFATAYAALIKGLFYYDDGLDALDELFEGARASDVDDAKAACMANGYDAQVYGRPVADVAQHLLDVVQSNLAKNERSYTNPLAQLVRTRKTLAMIGRHE